MARGLCCTRVDEMRELRGFRLHRLSEFEAATISTAGGDRAVANYDVVQGEVVLGRGLRVGDGDDLAAGVVPCPDTIRTEKITNTTKIIFFIQNS